MLLEEKDGSRAELQSQVEVLLEKSICLQSRVNFSGVNLKSSKSIFSDAITETKFRSKGQAPEPKDGGH